MENLREKLDFLKEKINLSEKKSKIGELKSLTEKPDFWKNPGQAAEVQREISELQKEVYIWDELENEISGISENSDSPESEKKIKVIELKIKKLELQIFLSGKYDRNNAILTVSSGVGGRDSQDWASMLLRMYLRYCEYKNWDATVLDESLGEEGGVKSATFEVRGTYAYGYLKNEAGVHRLVRLSPFSPNKLRHTSFAALEVLPEIEAKDIEIKSDDLRVDLFRSSGAGGQNVNKRETAVRITHIPTGISVAVQTERSQQQNREKAEQLLATKLNAYQLKKEDEELSKNKKITKSAEWGAQIRSYVLHPYQMVKDHRTEHETSQTEKVLDGDLDEFVEEELRRSG